MTGIAIEDAYRERIHMGELQLDRVQLELAMRLEALRLALEDSRLSSKSSSLGWLFNKRQKKEKLKGLYIWGSVGRGKSMLMDLFFANVEFTPKRRVHFHDFMADAQERIHQHRQDHLAGKNKEEDPIPPVAAGMAREAMLLCFDEFSVTDIADAMILGRLFKVLFEKGVVVIATSNVAPDDLYRDGLNRQRFLPFITILKDHCEVVELDARTDYRLEKLSKAPVYLAPLGPKAKSAMDEAWRRMTGGADETSETLVIKGRKLDASRVHDGLARFTFAELCQKPLGAQDYLAIARRFHTVFIDDIPMMGLSDRNAAKRFINLIDAFYDQKIRLVVTAAANPHALYQGKTGTEAFEFQRTASRLIEMQSAEYLAGELQTAAERV
jgi:cell division protein ZapE